MKTLNENLEYVIKLAEDAVYDGEYRQAENLLYSALMDEPGYAKLHYTIAWMNNFYKFNEREAEHYYLWALHFDPDYEDAFMDLVDMYLDKRQYAKLKKLMLKAEKASNPDIEFINKMLGKVAEAEKDFNTALKYYRKALMSSIDVGNSAELKQNIKRIRFKQFKTKFKRWQLTE